MISQVRIWVRQRLDDINDHIRKFYQRLIRKTIEMLVSDLEMMLSFRDLTSSASFADENFRDVAGFKTRNEMFEWVLGQVKSDNGLFLEFGVYKGNSINRLATLKP